MTPIRAAEAPAYDFSGQLVVITGASRGLGEGCARAFAAAGAEVVLVGRSVQPLEALREQIAAAGGKARVLVCDVTDAQRVRETIGALERCDVLVNNAGANKPQPFLEVDLPTLDELLALNVRSMFVVAQSAARLMVAAGRGAIVNMSSQMGHVGGPNRTVYCAAKHAIEGLTKAMAVELAPRGVRVNAVAPTYILTPMTEPYFENERFRQEVIARIPAGRIGEVAEVVNAVLFLSSPHASLITGTSLRVDGGYTAQ